VITNYANTFSDGRKVKSTSIGVKDESGEYVAALCLNVDLTLFQSFQGAISQFTRIDDREVHEQPGHRRRPFGTHPRAHRRIRGHAPPVRGRSSPPIASSSCRN
jgi:hypothetical protein